MKLKPCPFCGHKPYASTDGENLFIECGNLNCVNVFTEDSRYKAIQRWNTRAEKPAEKTAHWDINCDGYYPFCSHCGEAAQRMSPFCSNCGRKMITRGHEDT